MGTQWLILSVKFKVSNVLQGVPKVIIQRFGLIAWPLSSDLQNFFGNVPEK